MKNTRVVITGIGPISSIGIGKNQFWDGLKNSKVNIEKVNYKFNSSKKISFYKHKLKEFDIRNFNIDKEKLKYLYYWKENHVDDDILTSIAALKLCIKDSGIKYNKKNNNIGLIYTHENPGLETYFSRILDVSFKYFNNNSNGKSLSKISYFNSMLKSFMKESFELQTFMPLFHIARIFDLHGYSLFINNACASGAYAIEEACKTIKYGKAKQIFIVGADIPDVYKYLWFDQLGIYSKTGRIKPFTNGADGFINGDGAAAILMEDYKTAKRRNAKIYCEYVSGNFSCEGWKVAFPNPLNNVYENVISKTLKDVNIRNKDVDLLIPHGVGTNISDRHEEKTFRKIFKSYTKNLCTVNLKPYLGHNLGGSVLLETIAIILMMKKEYVIANLDLSESSYSQLKIEKVPIVKSIKYALKTTSAFAGFNSAILLKKV